MGVPVFFKWLCMRNPKIIRDAVERSHGDFESGNPHVDNFYVDMNGLIHPACNPKGEDIREPTNFEEQCQNIYDYIDKIINVVRPKRLVYLAVDGVAPRAKMNQQRSRRFRAAMEGVEIAKKKGELLDKYKEEMAVDPELEQYAGKKSFDSNLITPGTRFLSDVCERIRVYIQDRLANDRLWKNLTVIFSDANCPGEGQHKIMEFIRQERASEGYDCNQHHCIYGADADLIMLSLVTHEPRFYIIRQIVVTAMDKFCTTCGKKGHYFMDCRTATSIQDEQVVADKHNAGSINVSFQFISIQMIREWLHLHFRKTSMSFPYDLQRIIDDFVFLCFFVGNDFLPHVPCLSIREGGIDVLLRVYEYCLGLTKDYITCAGEIVLASLKTFLSEMKLYQQELINEIIEKQSYQKQRDSNDRNRFPARNSSKTEAVPIDFRAPLTSFKEELKRVTNPDLNIENYSVFSHPTYNYKEKYYTEKFRITACEYLQLRTSISRTYIEALHWICLYYYKGVASWSWYYPFHYSPFFTDIDVEETPVFEEGRPFKPFEQLMAVLPPKTVHALPVPMQRFMLEVSSPIADYFPSQFMIDLVGKKFAWLGEVLLPFIDDKRLLKAIDNYENTLTKEEKYLNRTGTVDIFIHPYGYLGRVIGDNNKKNDLLPLFAEQHGIEGGMVFLAADEHWVRYQFRQPSKRPHSIHLKEGVQCSILEELDDHFVSKTDKKGFGGERFVRVIERVLSQRANLMRRQSNSKEESVRDRERSRSRDRDKEERRDPQRGRNQRRDEPSRRERDEPRRRERDEPRRRDERR